jgi:uncharacterized protein (DUF58 family)
MRPTARAVLLLAAGLPVALVPVFASSRLWTVWVAYLALALLLLGLDGLLALPGRALRVRVTAPDTLTIGEEGSCEVHVSATERAPATELELLCDLHPSFMAQPAQKVVLAPPGEALARVALRAERRGRLQIEAAWLRWTGPLGLWRRDLRVSVDRLVTVVPDVRAVRSAALRFFSSRQLVSGLKVQRYVGDGSEFDDLREYQPGLDHRAIDWKASARHRKLLCQEFRAERNQQIVLALDTGHLMAEPLGGLPRLDHAIDASLMLAYFGLRLGDRVGLFGFDRQVRAYSEPEGGLRAFPRIQKLAAQLDYGSAETNFTLGLAELASRLRRRSLVVVMTDFADTVTAELMVENLGRLARKQLVLFVALRDPELDRIATGRPGRLGDLYRSVVAADFAREREAVLLKLRRLGVRCVDAVPSSVSAQLLNRYLDIKRRELI